MRLGADAAGPPGRGCCCCCCGAIPRLPTAPSLSLQLCAERGAERMREASQFPLVVLSPSPSHASSPRPPQITVPLSLLPNPPLPLSMALLNRPIHPPLPSLLPLPVHFPPFPVPLSLSPPSFPFLTLPFPLSRYPCDLPQPFWPFVFPSRGRGSTRSVRLRGWEDWEGERERDREHERAGPV
jgi:hypothetical protein